MTKFIGSPKKLRDFNFIELEIHKMNTQLGLMMENAIRDTYTFDGEIDFHLIKAYVEKFLGDGYEITEAQNMPKWNGFGTQQFIVVDKNFSLTCVVNVLKNPKYSKIYDDYLKYLCSLIS